jgi:DTW domain-containing protein YfiP
MNPSNPDVVSVRRARERCARCGLPLPTCLCGLATPTANRVDVLVLQHPREAREAKGSGRLLRLSLARCRVEIGERFDEPTLATLLHGDGRRSVLLYPGDGETAESEPFAAGAPSQLVVLDGTWRKSLRMLKANPLLQTLPRLRIVPAAASRYGALRKAPRPNQLSTLEATCAALATIEDDGIRYALLLEAFDRFVVVRSAWSRGDTAPPAGRTT